jgi:polyhydroxyalkanoate synthesis regulator phasin
MPRDDKLKKVQEAGADFLEAARARAEEFLRELAKAGEGTQGKAHGALDELLEGSRKGTETLLSSIRKEISSQLGLLGLATKEDLADLEARLHGGASGTRKAAATKPAADSATAKKATAKKAQAKTTAAKKAPAKKTAG